jgi:hypothetical protein
MTDKHVVKIIHESIKQKDKWYIDFFSPDIPELQDICEQAKEYADNALSGLSSIALYSRYKKWVKGNPIVSAKEHYFHAFINDLVFDLGLSGLKGRDKELFNESCYLTHHFY